MAARPAVRTVPGMPSRPVAAPADTSIDVIVTLGCVAATLAADVVLIHWGKTRGQDLSITGVCRRNLTAFGVTTAVFVAHVTGRPRALRKLDPFRLVGASAAALAGRDRPRTPPPTLT